MHVSGQETASGRSPEQQSGEPRQPHFGEIVDGFQWNGSQWVPLVAPWFPPPLPTQQAPVPPAKKKPILPLSTVLTIIVVILVGWLKLQGTDAPRDPSGEVTAPAQADVFSLRVGDCLTDYEPGEGDVSSVKVVPCAKKHDVEAYASMEMTGDTYPGDDAISKQASAFCTAEFATFIGVASHDSRFGISELTPTKASWGLNGDHEILCLVGDPAGEVTGSLKGVSQ